MQSRLTMGVNDAAALLGVSHWTVKKFIRQGRVKCVRIGRRVLVEPAELERLVERGRSGVEL
jgi:excisionase family DNA binding protein